MCSCCKEHLSLPSSEPKTITNMMRTIIKAITVAITPLLRNLPCAAAFVLHSGSCILNESVLRGFSSWLFAFIASLIGPALNQDFKRRQPRLCVIFSAILLHLNANSLELNSKESLEYHWTRVRKRPTTGVVKVFKK